MAVRAHRSPEYSGRAPIGISHFANAAIAAARAISVIHRATIHPSSHIIEWVQH